MIESRMYIDFGRFDFDTSMIIQDICSLINSSNNYPDLDVKNF